MRVSVFLKVQLFLLVLLLGLAKPSAYGQQSFLEPADTLNKARFWTVTLGGAAIYTGFSIGLYNTWYKDFPRTNLRSFDDWGEWNQMDKAGHLFTAYIESNLSFGGALWTGMDRRSAMWTAAGVGMLLQTTVEVMDGFSAQWGWSWSDAAFNTAGVGLFVGQELLWEEQRILMKVSNRFPRYSEAPLPATNGEGQSNIKEWAEDIYGAGLAERFLKDYNGQTIWASVNIKSFLREKDNFFPGWLNIAFGYGVDNVFGAYGNSWQRDDGAGFRLDPIDYPRYRQYYISFDVDMSRLPIKNRFLRTLAGALNWIKIPSPTLEFNSLGEVKFHPFYW
ncbi:MAG: DUF2279 domain-containing protein [Bacteroidota bacterium]